eukprot:s3809_g4.t2
MMSRCFKATQRSSYEQLRDQIAQRAKGRSAVDFYDEGVTPLLSYMFFVLHYHENYLTVENLHQWPIIPHSKMRHYTDRIVFSRQNSLPVSKILKDDVEEVLRFLLTRFGPAARPFLPVIPIGQREIVTLARSIIASKIPPCMCGNCPPNTCQDLSTAVQVPQHDDVLSFYGKATQEVHYQPSMLDFISKLHHGTKNSAGVVVGGFMGTPHHKSKSSSTVHEGHLCKFHALVHSPSGDKRWAVREAAGRFDRIWILSSTHSAQISMSTASDSQARKAVTLEAGDGNDWGVSWPGLEDAIRKPKAFGPSEVKRVKREA